MYLGYAGPTPGTWVGWGIADFPALRRAFWRRGLRTGRVKFYLTVLTLLGWMAAVALPDSLSRAAGELAAGQTASMDRLLLVLCLLWLVVLGEDLNVSLSSDRLRRFRLTRAFVARAQTVIALPVADRVAGHDRVAAWPVSASVCAPPLLGSLAALFFLALTIGFGVSVSQPLGIAGEESYSSPSRRSAPGAGVRAGRCSRGPGR